MNPWLALSNYVAAPAKGKTIYEAGQNQNDTGKALAISGGILAVGLLAVFILTRK